MLFLGQVQAVPASAWLQDQTGNMHRTTGRFVNDDYGFSVEPPPGAAEYVTNGGDANHGPTFILGERRMIVVYPEYVDSDDDDDKPCRRDQFPWEPSSARVAAASRIGEQTACVVTFTRREMVWRAMQTLGNDRGTGIMYTLLLTTTRRWSRADFQSLQRVADSFGRVPISD